MLRSLWRWAIYQPNQVGVTVMDFLLPAVPSSPQLHFDPIHEPRRASAGNCIEGRFPSSVSRVLRSAGEHATCCGNTLLTRRIFVGQKPSEF